MKMDSSASTIIHGGLDMRADDKSGRGRARHVPESGLVDDRFLGEHTPHSRSWYQHARINGDGPPSYRLGKKIVYKWREVVAWLESQLDGGR